MFLRLPSLGASSLRPAVSSGPPRISSAEYKKLIRLVVPKVKLGSDSFTVKKQCLALVKSHKLNVSAGVCRRRFVYVFRRCPQHLPDVFPVDFVSQVRNTLDQGLSKIPAVEFIDLSVITCKFYKFMSTHSVSSRFRTTVYAHVRAFVNRTRKKQVPVLFFCCEEFLYWNFC